MENEIEITCQCQMETKVSLQWCDLAQHQQLCAGCPHNDGRKRSKYQIKKDRQTYTASKERK